MSYGTKIYTLRKAAGLSQRQLGVLCGYEPKVGECTVQHWEHDRRYPPIEVIRKLAEALNVTVDDLIP